MGFSLRVVIPGVKKGTCTCLCHFNLDSLKELSGDQRGRSRTEHRPFISILISPSPDLAVGRKNSADNFHSLCKKVSSQDDSTRSSLRAHMPYHGYQQQTANTAMAEISRAVAIDFGTGRTPPPAWTLTISHFIASFFWQVCAPLTLYVGSWSRVLLKHFSHYPGTQNVDEGK